MSETRSFVDVLEELRLLLLRPATPVEVRSSALRVIERIEECLWVVPQVEVAGVALEPPVSLQPSDFFLHYVAAVRALDWPKVAILEHERLRRREDGG